MSIRKLVAGVCLALPLLFAVAVGLALTAAMTLSLGIVGRWLLDLLLRPA